MFLAMIFWKVSKYVRVWLYFLQTKCPSIIHAKFEVSTVDSNKASGENVKSGPLVPTFPYIAGPLDVYAYPPPYTQ